MTAGSSARKVAARTQGVAVWAERRAARFAQGSEGERAVADAVAPLSANGWFILHDRAAPRGGNIDHVLVGRGGVVVLDAKAWSGELSISPSGRLRHAGKDAHGAVTALESTISFIREALPSTPVSGGLVFVGNSGAAALPRRLGDVGLCDVAEVAGVLERKPTVLETRDVETTLASLIDLLPAAGPIELERPDHGDPTRLDLEASQMMAAQPVDRRYRFYVARSWSRSGKRRIYLNAADRTALGWIDRSDGTCTVETGATDDAEPLLRRLHDPSLVPDPDVTSFNPVRGMGGRLLRFLGTDRRGTGHVVASVWRRGETRRLYVSLHLHGIASVSVGWVDLMTGEEHANDPVRAGLLTYAWAEVFDAVIQQR